MIPTNRQATSPVDFLLLDIIIPNMHLTPYEESIMKRILVDRQRINRELAVELSKIYQLTSVQYWLNMQANYDNSKDTK